MSDQEDPDDPLLLACQRVGEAMDLFDEAASAALGVGRSDLRALNLLEHGPLSHTEIGRRLGLSRASVTGLVDRLEAAGYVRRHADAADRRTVRVALEPATFAAFAAVYRPLGERVREAAAGVPREERTAVVAALERMASAFAQARADLSVDPPR